MSDVPHVVLGVDPGTLFTGYGVLSFTGNRVAYLESGTIAKKGELNDRLYEMFKELQEITKRYRPHSLSIETSFVHKNVATAIKLGQARGMFVGAVKSVCSDTKVYEYSPRVIKQNIVGKGNATKEQLIYMVKSMLNLRDALSADASDALGCALCHYNHHQLLKQIK